MTSVLLALFLQLSVGSSARDSLAANIASFSQRFNFTLPLIVVLFIFMFFLLLKSYTMETQESAATTDASKPNGEGQKRTAKTVKKVKAGT